MDRVGDEKIQINVAANQTGRFLLLAAAGLLGHSIEFHSLNINLKGGWVGRLGRTIHLDNNNIRVK